MALIVGANEIKEKILRNISSTLQEIHRLSTERDENEESSLTITNDDWQVHCLLEHLDFALLFGLRTVPDGYFPCVREFMAKDFQHQIESLFNVETNIGRGRAWFFHALNENLTESYIRCFQDNRKLMKNFYITDSIIFDNQRLNTLITLCSGLENVQFNLKTDCPYFDRECWPAYFQDNLAENEKKFNSFPTLKHYFSRYSTSHVPFWLSRDEKRRVAARAVRLTTNRKKASTISSVETSVVSSEVIVESLSGSPSSSISFDNPAINDENPSTIVDDFSIPTPLTPELSSSLSELDPMFHTRVRTPSPVQQKQTEENPFETPSSPEPIIEEKPSDPSPIKLDPIEELFQSNIEDKTQFEADVNLQLQFNLEIFENTEEMLNYFFPCTIGHNNGNIEYVSLLLTQLNIYLIRQIVRTNASNRLEKIESIRLEEIDYIETGPFGQFFRLISSKNKRFQCITTGSKNLTNAISNAIETVCSSAGVSIPKTLPAAMQELSIKKELSKDMKISNPQDVILSDYHFIFWEEPQMSGRQLRKEGLLLVKIMDKSLHKHLLSSSSQKQFIAQFESWREAYVTLKVDRLNIYLKQSDKEPILTYTLIDENCQGCRRARNVNQEYSLEILFGSDLILSFGAKTKSDQDQWVNAVMKSLSQGRMAFNENGSNMNTVPCSLMLTEQKLYLCHDENDNALIRQLESAKIDHIEKIFVDVQCPYYCVLSIEQTHQGSKTWIFYFLFANEMIRFVKHLQRRLSDIFQVLFEIDALSDTTLQTECQQTLTQLRTLYNPIELM